MTEVAVTIANGGTMEQEISVTDATTVRKFKEDVLAGLGADGSAMKAEELCAKVTLKAKGGISGPILGAANFLQGDARVPWAKMTPQLRDLIDAQPMLASLSPHAAEDVSIFCQGTGSSAYTSKSIRKPGGGGGGGLASRAPGGSAAAAGAVDAASGETSVRAMTASLNASLLSEHALCNRPGCTCDAASHGGQKDMDRDGVINEDDTADGQHIWWEYVLVWSRNAYDGGGDLYQKTQGALLQKLLWNVARNVNARDALIGTLDEAPMAEAGGEGAEHAITLVDHFREFVTAKDAARAKVVTVSELEMKVQAVRASKEEYKKKGYAEDWGGHNKEAMAVRSAPDLDAVIAARAHLDEREMNLLRCLAIGPIRLAREAAVAAYEFADDLAAEAEAAANPPPAEGEEADAAAEGGDAAAAAAAEGDAEASGDEEGGAEEGGGEEDEAAKKEAEEKKAAEAAAAAEAAEAAAAAAAAEAAAEAAAQAERDLAAAAETAVEVANAGAEAAEMGAVQAVQDHLDAVTTLAVTTANDASSAADRRRDAADDAVIDVVTRLHKCFDAAAQAMELGCAHSAEHVLRAANKVQDTISAEATAWLVHRLATMMVSSEIEEEAAKDVAAILGQLRRFKVKTIAQLLEEFADTKRVMKFTFDKVIYAPRTHRARRILNICRRVEKRIDDPDNIEAPDDKVADYACGIAIEEQRIEMNAALTALVATCTSCKDLRALELPAADWRMLLNAGKKATSSPKRRKTGIKGADIHDTRWHLLETYAKTVMGFDPAAERATELEELARLADEKAAAKAAEKEAAAAAEAAAAEGAEGDAEASGDEEGGADGEADAEPAEEEVSEATLFRRRRFAAERINNGVETAVHKLLIDDFFVTIQNQVESVKKGLFGKSKKKKAKKTKSDVGLKDISADLEIGDLQRMEKEFEKLARQEEKFYAKNKMAKKFTLDAVQRTLQRAGLWTKTFQNAKHRFLKVGVTEARLFHAASKVGHKLLACPDALIVESKRRESIELSRQLKPPTRVKMLPAAPPCQCPRACGCLGFGACINSCKHEFKSMGLVKTRSSVIPDADDASGKARDVVQYRYFGGFDDPDTQMEEPEQKKKPVRSRIREPDDIETRFAATDFVYLPYDCRWNRGLFCHYPVEPVAFGAWRMHKEAQELVPCFPCFSKPLPRDPTERHKRLTLVEDARVFYIDASGERRDAVVSKNRGNGDFDLKIVVEEEGVQGETIEGVPGRQVIPHRKRRGCCGKAPSEMRPIDMFNYAELAEGVEVEAFDEHHLRVRAIVMSDHRNGWVDIAPVGTAIGDEVVPRRRVHASQVEAVHPPAMTVFRPADRVKLLEVIMKSSRDDVIRGKEKWYHPEHANERWFDPEAPYGMRHGSGLDLQGLTIPPQGGGKAVLFAAFPLHDRGILKQLRRDWVIDKRMKCCFDRTPWAQPVDARYKAEWVTRILNMTGANYKHSTSYLDEQQAAAGTRNPAQIGAEARRQEKKAQQAHWMLQNDLVGWRESRAIVSDAELGDDHKRFHRMMWITESQGISDYFGQSMAIYFGWLSFLTVSIFALGLMGLAVHIINDYKVPYITSGDVVNTGLIDVVFCFLVLLWGASFIELWKQAQHYLAKRWGTREMEDVLMMRPQHKGEPNLVKHIAYVDVIAPFAHVDADTMEVVEKEELERQKKMELLLESGGDAGEESTPLLLDPAAMALRDAQLDSESDEDDEEGDDDDIDDDIQLLVAMRLLAEKSKFPCRARLVKRKAAGVEDIEVEGEDQLHSNDWGATWFKGICTQVHFPEPNDDIVDVDEIKLFPLGVPYGELEVHGKMRPFMVTLGGLIPCSKHGVASVSLTNTMGVRGRGALIEVRESALDDSAFEIAIGDADGRQFRAHSYAERTKWCDSFRQLGWRIAGRPFEAPLDDEGVACEAIYRRHLAPYTDFHPVFACVDGPGRAMLQKMSQIRYPGALMRSPYRRFDGALVAKVSFGGVDPDKQLLDARFALAVLQSRAEADVEDLEDMGVEKLITLGGLSFTMRALEDFSNIDETRIEALKQIMEEVSTEAHPRDVLPALFGVYCGGCDIEGAAPDRGPLFSSIWLDSFHVGMQEEIEKKIEEARNGGSYTIGEDFARAYNARPDLSGFARTQAIEERVNEAVEMWILWADGAGRRGAKAASKAEIEHLVNVAAMLEACADDAGKDEEIVSMELPMGVGRAEAYGDEIDSNERLHKFALTVGANVDCGTDSMAGRRTGLWLRIFHERCLSRARKRKEDVAAAAEKAAAAAAARAADEDADTEDEVDEATAEKVKNAELVAWLRSAVAHATREGDAAQAVSSGRFMRTLNERFKREIIASGGDDVDEEDFRKSLLIHPKLEKGVFEFTASDSGKLTIRFRLAGFCLSEPESDSESSDVEDEDDERLEPYLMDSAAWDALKFSVAFAAFDFTRYGASIGMKSSDIADKAEAATDPSTRYLHACWKARTRISPAMRPAEVPMEVKRLSSRVPDIFTAVDLALDLDLGSAYSRKLSLDDLSFILGRTSKDVEDERVFSASRIRSVMADFNEEERRGKLPPGEMPTLDLDEFTPLSRWYDLAHSDRAVYNHMFDVVFAEVPDTATGQGHFEVTSGCTNNNCCKVVPGVKTTSLPLKFGLELPTPCVDWLGEQGLIFSAFTMILTLSIIVGFLCFTIAVFKVYATYINKLELNFGAVVAQIDSIGIPATGILTSLPVVGGTIMPTLGNITVAYGVTAAGVAQGVIMTVFNGIFEWLATWLTDIENHATDERYEFSYIIKYSIFQFFNSYFPQIYVAFIKVPVHQYIFQIEVMCSGPQGSCIAELKQQLIIILAMKITIDNVKELMPSPNQVIMGLNRCCFAPCKAKCDDCGKKGKEKRKAQVAISPEDEKVDESPEADVMIDRWTRLTVRPRKTGLKALFDPKLRKLARKERAEVRLTKKREADATKAARMEEKGRANVIKAEAKAKKAEEKAKAKGASAEVKAAKKAAAAKVKEEKRAAAAVAKAEKKAAGDAKKAEKAAATDAKKAAAADAKSAKADATKAAAAEKHDGDFKHSTNTEGDPEASGDEDTESAAAEEEAAPAGEEEAFIAPKEEEKKKGGKMSKAEKAADAAKKKKAKAEAGALKKAVSQKETLRACVYHS